MRLKLEFLQILVGVPSIPQPQNHAKLGLSPNFPPLTSASEPDQPASSQAFFNPAMPSPMESASQAATPRTQEFWQQCFKPAIVVPVLALVIGGAVGGEFTWLKSDIAASEVRLREEIKAIKDSIIRLEDYIIEN